MHGTQAHKDKLHEFGALQVLQLAVLQDNYSYLLHDNDSGMTVALDPAADPKIVAELTRRGWPLHAIWNTHWHADHCGGNAALLQYAARASANANIEVAAYSHQKIAECTRSLRSGHTLRLGKLQFTVYEVPGHTLDHLLFVCPGQAGNNYEILAFCGDALFPLGCGRLFEGTPSQMLQSLDCLAGLPPPTRLFCAHEYTRANLRFALSLEAENPVLQDFARKLADNNVSGVPSTLAFELAANPFLRLRHQNFAAALTKKLPAWPLWPAAKRLQQIRKMKDNFS